MSVSYTHLGVYKRQPTGSDKNQGFALSNNRWATDLQVGYIRKLSNNWTVDLIGETEFYPVSYTHLDVYKRQTWRTSSSTAPS